jgi:hypothetical protein
MNLDELMAVWRTQDAAPLHDVNKTLLQQTLLQDEARLQKERRTEKWVVYLFGAGVVAAIMLCLAQLMHFHRLASERHGAVTVWDYGMGIAGAAAALLAWGLVYVGHRAQARREQRFGESLRDQINRRIAQLDDATTGGRRRSLLLLVLVGAVFPTAILHFFARINGKTLSDVSFLPFATIIWCLLLGSWTLRRSAQRGIGRKRRLEELLKELDGQ